MTQTPTLSEPQTAAQPQYTITDKDRKRVENIQKAWDAYDGELEPPLQKTPDGIDPNVLSNLIEGPVDAGGGFLFGKELEITVEEGAPQEAQDFLNSVWGEKEARIPLLLDLCMNGAMAGRAFLRIVPTNNPETPYRLITVDPAIVYPQTDPQDVETVLCYHLEYSVEETREGKPVTIAYCEEITRIDPDHDDDDIEDAVATNVPDVDMRWQIQHWSRISVKGGMPSQDAWTPAGEPIPWNYPFPPIFSCKNRPRPNSFWGKPDVTKSLIGINKSINLKQSVMQLNDILTGQVILYATGMGEGILENQPGKIHRLPDVDSKIVAVPIPDHSAGALKQLDDLRSDIDQITGFPGISTGRLKDMPHGNMSGIAIELMFMASLMRTYVKQCLYGKLILDVSQALLVLNGMSGTIKITLPWASPLPKDDLQDVQAVLAKMEAGLSKTSALRQLGEDPEEELQLAQSEEEQKLIAYAQGKGLPPGIPGSPALPGQQFPPLAPAPGQAPAPMAGGQQ